MKWCCVRASLYLYYCTCIIVLVLLYLYMYGIYIYYHLHQHTLQHNAHTNNNISTQHTPITIHTPTHHTELVPNLPDWDDSAVLAALEKDGPYSSPAPRGPRTPSPKRPAALPPTGQRPQSGSQSAYVLLWCVCVCVCVCVCCIKKRGSVWVRHMQAPPPPNTLNRSTATNGAGLQGGMSALGATVVGVALLLALL